jgi:methyl-accepting chemotaxis protein WspA
MVLTIGRRIGLSYFLAILVIILIGIISYFSINQLLTATQWVEHTYKVIRQIDNVYTDLIEVENAQRGYVLIRDEDRLKTYNENSATLQDNFDELKELTKDSDVQQKALEQLRPEIDARLRLTNQVVNAQKAGNTAEALSLLKMDRGKSHMGTINKIIDAMHAEENERMLERNSKAEANARFAIVSSWLAIIFTPIALGIIGLFIVRSISQPLGVLTTAATKISSGDLDVSLQDMKRNDEIGSLNQAFTRMLTSLQGIAGAAERVAEGDLSTKIEVQSKEDVVSQSLLVMCDNLSSLIGQVQRSGIQVNSSVTEIAAISKQQQATASQISTTTTEIGSTSKEIAATSRELAGAMKEVAQTAEATSGLASTGQTGLVRMEKTMSQVMEASSSISSRLSILSEKASNINSVVTTINKIADQTNLLSLNAAIEAEKAGEYGRGFSVVATEIRRLADQTAAATSEVEQIIKEIQSAVSASVMGMDKFAVEVRQGGSEVQQVSEVLTQIIEQVQAMQPSFEWVNDGMQTQSLGAQQISDALLQLGEAARQTVESLSQSNSAIEQLDQALRGLQSGVARFKLRSGDLN